MALDEHILALSVLCLVAACNPEESDTDTDNTVEVGSSVIEPCDNTDASTSPGIWPVVSAGYGVVETVAGIGLVTEKGANGWRDEFEGLSATEVELSRPHMTQADSEGRLYIADKDAHAIRRVDFDGTIHTVAGIGERGAGTDDIALATTVALDGPNGLYVGGDGTVYILDLYNGRIRRLNVDGTMGTLFTDDELATGRGLWVSPDEERVLYSSNHRLMQWTPDTGSTTLGSGFGDLGNLAVSPSGVVTVTDRNAGQVIEVYGDGARVIAGNGLKTDGEDGVLSCETALQGVRGIWFHPDGGYFLGTHEGSQVWFVDVDQRMHLVLDGADDAHSGDGELWSSGGLKLSEVRSVSMDRDLNLIVTENDGGFIRRVRYGDSF